jgi:hypothetical protein
MTANLLVALLIAFALSAGSQTTSTMQRDVDALVRVAERLEGTWPGQPPPPIREVAIVAGHGRDVVPLLLALLSDDANVERDRRRWTVH